MTIKEKLKVEIDELNDDIAEEVFNFVRFIELEKERNQFVKSAQTLSEQAFGKVWNNEKDAVYDKL